MTPIVSNPLSGLRIATESAFGVAPNSGWRAINPRPFALPEMAQAVIENANAVRTGFAEPRPFAGVKGGAGPQLVFPLFSAVPARATADTDAAPDPWAIAAWGAAIGSGAGVSSTQAYAAGNGLVSGGSTIASVVNAGTPSRTTAVAVQAGHGARFSEGQLIVIVHAGVPYLAQVATISTDTLNLKGGPLASAGLTADDVVYGGWTCNEPSADGAANVGASIALELAQRDGQISRLTGCNGTVSMELTAKEEGTLTFDFQHDGWDTGSGVSALGGSPTAYPADARARILGIETYVRIGTADENGVYDVLTAPLATSAVKLDLGIERNEIADVGGLQGRAGRVITAIKPRLTFTPYDQRDFVAALGSPGNVGDRRSISVIAGNATIGFWGVFFRAGQLFSPVRPTDVNALQGAEWTFLPTDDGGGRSRWAIFQG